ncbi:MAG: trypsin-like peptidase domain-containing protein [Candidatus Glassbacteria bacterium]
MPKMTWWQAVEQIEPHVVRISTPRGSGSGFMISNGRKNEICGIATAAHVVDQAHYWEEPIRIDHVSTGKYMVVRRDERAVLLDLNRDTAAILFHRAELSLPATPLPLPPKDTFLKVGNEIAWLGFPAIPAANLCFFTGHVSAWINAQSAYLVDGVAINGVSGGPAFLWQEGKPAFVVVMGVVSAYVPNRATGEVLPGLSIVRDVAQFQELAPTFASLDQAIDAESPAELPPPAPDVEAQAETPVRRST